MMTALTICRQTEQAQSRDREQTAADKFERQTQTEREKDCVREFDDE